jgi:peptide/nickel transport system ATP-binding protein
VMYHGRIVESGPAGEIFSRPAHPYTRGLLDSQPTLKHGRDLNPLVSIAGAPPAAAEELPGCAFAPRCAVAESRCSAEIPVSIAVSKDRWAACILAKAGEQIDNYQGTKTPGAG